MTGLAESTQMELARRARGWCASVRGGIVLVLLCVAVYLPGVASLPPMDRDESRFAQASRQMLASGDFVVPRVQEKARLNKPPLIYWMQAGAAWVATGGDASRDAIWMYRVPSVIAAVLAAVATWRLGLGMFDARVAWWGALCLAYCPMVYWEARQARADEVLLAATAWAVYFQWQIAAGERRGRARGLDVLGLWCCVAAGVMTKGPITPMVVLLGAGARCVAERSVRPLTQIRPMAGMAVVALVISPWIVAVGERVGWGNYVGLVRGETIGRAAEAKEGHGGWPLYHLTLAPGIYFPGTLLLGAGVARAVVVSGLGGWVRRRFAGGGERVVGRAVGRVGRPAEVFLLCTIVPSWVVFEAVSTKLPHYTLPLLPAVCLVCARAIWSRRVRCWLGLGFVRGLVWVWIVTVGVFIVTAGSVTGWVAWAGGAVWVMAGAGAVTMVSLGTSMLMIVRAWRRRDMLAMLKAALGVFAIGATMLVLAIPRLPAWLTRDVVREIERIDPGGAEPIADIHLREDSVVVGTHGRAQHVEEEDFDAWADGHPGGLVLLDAQYADVWARVEPITTISGVNYSIGRRMGVVIGRVRPAGTEGVTR